ncbi:MAG: GEVED domain-containing protein [Bacteroidales bacterium]
MERKTTKFKYLLLIPALFLGMSVIAQKAEPVKLVDGKKTVEAVSNYRPGNGQLEQQIQGILDGKGGEAVTAKPKPVNKADNPSMWKDYDAKKALLVLEEQKKNQTDKEGQPKLKQLQMETVHSAGLAPVGHATIAPPASTIPNGKYPTDIAYCDNAYGAASGIPTGPCYFPLNTPGGITNIAPYTGTDFLAGSSWALGEWYCGVYSASGDSPFVKINTTTGARTVINPATGISITALAYDWTTNTMYALGYTSSTSLYTIDLITGVPTLVGNIGAYLGISMACNELGNLYMVDIIADVLVQIDKTTAAPTVIGSIGFSANYAQDMEFDNSDNTMYYAAYNAGGTGGELRTVNVTTGATTLIGGFPGGMEVTGFAIQNLPFITYPDDLGISQYVGPASSELLTNNELIQVKIKNYGSDPQVNFPVSYTINGGTPVINVCNLTVAPGAVVDFTFTTPADFSAYNNYNITVCTALPGDQNTMNDCKSVTISKIMPTWTDTMWPQDLPYWTGTTNGTTFTQNSLIKLVSGASLTALNQENGWAKFDISSIPDVTQISNVKLGYYTQVQSGAPYFSITQMSNDPMTGTPLGVLTDIVNGPVYLATQGQSPPGYQVGPHVHTLPAAARTDLANSVLQDWFAVGFWEHETSVGSYTGTIEGWNETHSPYLVVTYGYVPGPNDCGITAITTPGAGAGLTNAEPVTVTLRNYGSLPQTSVPITVVINGPGGTQTINYTWTGTLAGGSVTNVVVGNGDFHLFGNYTMQACTQLTGDNFANNDCFGKAFGNLCPLDITAVVSPVSGPGLTASEPFNIALANLGSVPLSNVDIQYTINGGAPVVVPFPGPLAAGNTVPSFSLGTLDMHLYGTYTIQICPIFPGNTLPNSGCITVNVVNSVPTVTDTFWPQDLPYWTGSTDGSTFTETSLISIVSGNVENGWAKFDISDMPAGVQVNSTNLLYYTQSQFGIPFAYIKRLVIDPMTNTPSTVMSAIISGALYVSASGLYNLGWHAPLTLGTMANTDLSNQTAFDWFAVSFYEYETSVGSYGGVVEGWQEVNTPYIVVNYTPPIPHDVAVMSIDVDPFIGSGPYIPKATVKNFGSNTESFTVTMDGPGGYISTKPVTNLAPGASIQVVFDSWNATMGEATLHACISMATDLNFGNDCKSKTFTVEAKLTKVYAFNAYDPSAVLPIGPVTFFLEHPEVITSLAPTVSTEFISGGTWANGVWYGAEYSYVDNSNLWTINPNTGAMTLIGPMGFNVSGMAYDHTTNTMWAVAAFQDDLGAWRTNIYTVDVTTGTSTLVRECGPIGLAINLACSQQGMLLFAEITNDRLWSYDPLVDELELMGPLGLNLNYAQDAEFDKETNILYFAGYSATGTLFTVNLATGAITSIGNFQGGAEICGFAIPYTWIPETVDMGAMWITHPKIGNLTDGEPVIMRVRNYGLTTCTDMDLTFQYLTTTYTDNWAVWGYPAIDPDIYFDYAFIPVLDLSAPGTHCIKTWISNVVPEGDMNQVNDTVAKCVNNISCGLITCFPNAIQEGEPCGNDENGGCYGTPNAYVDIASDEVYCGTLWKVDEYRDTDWYKFTLGTPKGIAVKARAEYGLNVILVKLPCDNFEVIETKTITKCLTDSLVFSALAAGQYAIVFAPDWIDFNTACNNNTKYTFSFNIRPAKYCPANTSICDEFVSNVQVNTTPAFSNPSNCTSGGYKDYTNLTINVDAGSTYSITVSNGISFYSDDQCGIWIDWNRDYDFFDVNEKLEVIGSPGVGPYTASFTVDPNAIPGPTRLRTRITWTGALEPCGTTSYGEVEDYTLYIHADIPAIIATVGSLTETCPGTKVVPVTVEEFNGVFGFNLVLQLDPDVTYLGYQNVHPELGTGTVTVNPIGNNVQMNWFSVIPASIGTGTLLDLVLQTSSGDHNLVWDQDACQFSSLVTGVFDDEYVDGILSFGNCSDLSGMIKYKNNQNSVIRDSVMVKLYTGGNVFFSETPVDNTGHYAFLNLPNNTYTMRAFSGPVPAQSPWQKVWVGGTATDALLILRHYVGMPPLLTGLNLTVGDVNGSGGTPNAVDALAVSRRFVQAITSFAPAPDWYFQNFTITIDGTANQVQEIRGLCAGDVNGSGIPLNSVPSKITPSVYLMNEGTLYIDNEIVDVPVLVQNGMSVGAVSLVLNYPNNLEVTGVKVANSPENLSFTTQNGQVRIAWFTTEAVDLNAGEVLVTLQVKATSVSDKDMSFFSTEESAIANGFGKDYESASLMMPKLVSLNGTDNYSLSNFPNPFNTTTDIHYSIAKSGVVTVKVYNVLGEEVATVVNAEQKAGNYTVTFDGSTLPKGVYVYKLQVNDVTKANSMVITQ